MEFPAAEAARLTPSRHEKSLGLLTTKFLSLLQQAKDGVLDLKVAADRLAVRQKRRIYDITNVLEGVGLIEKKNKNIIQWRGESSSSQTEEMLEQVRELKAQISELEVQERELDDQKAFLEENIKHLDQDPNTSTYKFVTHEDVCDAFRGRTLLAVAAPAGTQLEVPVPQTGQRVQKKYQMNLRSEVAPIRVVLINRDLDSALPLVFPVPPTEDMCPMPTPPHTPASLSASLTPTHCSQDSLCSDHQMALPDQDDMLTPSSTPPDVTMESGPIAALEQHMDLTDPDFQSVLDVSTLLKLTCAEDHMKDDGDEAVDLMDEFMSAGAIDYSFNLDDNEGVCDLFDVQILNQ